MKVRNGITGRAIAVERTMGIEPSFSAWKDTLRANGTSLNLRTAPFFWWPLLTGFVRDLGPVEGPDDIAEPGPACTPDSDPGTMRAIGPQQTQRCHLARPCCSRRLRRGHCESLRHADIPRGQPCRYLLTWWRFDAPGAVVGLIG